MIGLSTAALLTSVFAFSTLGLVMVGDNANAADGDNSNSGPGSANSGPGNANKHDDDKAETASPIKHVIILIGENRGLDHTFGVYKPKGKGETISNLLSKGIVKLDGTPGPNFALAQQFSVAPQPQWYFGAPQAAKTPYNAINIDAAAQHQRGAASAEHHRRAVHVRGDRAGHRRDRPQRRRFRPTDDRRQRPARRTVSTRVSRAPAICPTARSCCRAQDHRRRLHRRHDAPLLSRRRSSRIAASANVTKANPTGCLNDLFPFVMATYSATNKSARQ